MCYEKFVDRFNENSFTISYLGSENFWPATTRFYYLSEKYGSRTQGMFIIGGMFGFIGKLLISFFTLYWAKFMYDGNLEYQQNIDYPGIVLGLCFLIGFVVGSLFINLFSTTFETLLTCYIVELNLIEFYNADFKGENKEIEQILADLRNDGKNPYEKL